MLLGAWFWSLQPREGEIAERNNGAPDVQSLLEAEQKGTLGGGGGSGKQR